MEPLAIAAGAGVLASWIVGIFIVAPRAAGLAKWNIFLSLADPSEEDLAIIQAASTHIIGNMGQIAADPEKRKLLAPVFGAFLDAINANFEMSIANLKSQRVRGVGVFNPENAMTDEQFQQQVVGGLLETVAEPFINALGFEGPQAEHTRNYIGIKLMGALGSNGGASSPPSSPSYRSQGSGGLDFRSR